MVVDIVDALLALVMQELGVVVLTIGLFELLLAGLGEVGDDDGGAGLLGEETDAGASPGHILLNLFP